MIRNAIGTKSSIRTVTAKTKRTIGRLKTRMSRICCPNNASVRISPIVSTASSGMRIASALPGTVS
jgi:hypothetical protein